MKLKNINPVERHMEKGILLIGLLFAIWLVYKNFLQEPDAVPLAPDQPFVVVQPGEVGQKIVDAVDSLNQKIKDAQEHPPTFQPVPEYLDQLTQAEQQPLSLDLLNMPNIVFGPSNAPLENVSSSGPVNYVYVVPKVPALTITGVEQNRGVAVITTPPAGEQGSSGPPQAPQTLDVVWVQLSAQFSMTKWISSLKAQDHVLGPKEQALPSSYQRTTFYHVDVQRQQQLANGQWGPWLDVPGTYLTQLPDVDLSQVGLEVRSAVLDSLDSQVDNILDPAFYTIRQAAQRIQSPALQPAPVQAPSLNNLRSAIAPPSQQPPQNPGPQNPGQPGAAALAGLTSQAQVPVSFYDASVVPGASYRYQMRIELYNPVYQMLQAITDPAAKNLQWLVSPWSNPTAVVHVSNNLYFYVFGGQAAAGAASIHIFKWIHGSWTEGDQFLHIAEPIGDVESVPLIDPNTGNLTPQSVDFSTGYELVDVISIASNDSVTIVISDPNGNLSLRNSASDATDPDQLKLIAAMQVGAPTNTGTPGQ